MKKRLITMFTLTIILSGQLFAQLKLEGYVKDVNGEALPGINIPIKGTVTNLDGYHSLSDVSTAMLMYSFKYRIKPVQGLKVNDQIRYDISNSRGKRYSQDYLVYNFVTTGSHRHILTNEVNSEILIEN